MDQEVLEVDQEALAMDQVIVVEEAMDQVALLVDQEAVAVYQADIVVEEVGTDQEALEAAMKGKALAVD